jgi:hypothetical protein
MSGTLVPTTATQEAALDHNDRPLLVSSGSSISVHNHDQQKSLTGTSFSERTSSSVMLFSMTSTWFTTPWSD